MKPIKAVYIGLIALALSACGSLNEGVGIASSSNTSYSKNRYHKTQGNHQRINTTECNDADDWYLDGYRVGSSFQSQKEAMLSQRSQYCGYTLARLPTQLKQNWDRGFRIGANSSSSKTKKTKKRGKV